METAFYKDGLRFQCTQCSSCCRHDPGFVFLNQTDYQNLMKATDLTREDFFSRYCRIVDINGFKRISLIEKENYDCIFWDDGCILYEARPIQCRSYPFWSPFLGSRDDWNSLESSCPGVNKGKLHSAKTIEHWLDARAESPFLSEEDFSDLL